LLFEGIWRKIIQWVSHVRRLILCSTFFVNYSFIGWVKLSIFAHMYLRVTESGGRRYLLIVEAYRNEAGQPRTRIIAKLGRANKLKDGTLDALIRGLTRVAGREEPPKLNVTFDAALSYGNVFALHELWNDLGFDHALNRALRSGTRSIDVEAVVRALVFNRLCDPTSKLGCLRWLDTVAMPAMPETVTHQHLLRAMDALMNDAEAVEDALAPKIRPLVDHDLTMVFYDLTTVRIHGEGKTFQNLLNLLHVVHFRAIRPHTINDLEIFLSNLSD
jgi:hypothetical protein